MGYKRAAKIAIAGLLFALVLRATWYVARLPGSNCSSKPVAQSWNLDHAFNATLIEKNCNAGETLFYSVRIDAYSPPLRSRWFIPGYELEGDDSFPREIPKLRWVTPRELEIEVKTRTFSGSIINRVQSMYLDSSGVKFDPSDDLLVQRKYTLTPPVLPTTSN